ncbi:MAG: IS4 family transposase [Bacteroidota bacterium]
MYTEIVLQTDKKINAARREFMTLYVAGMIQSRSVHSKDVASFMDSGVKIDSDIRRIERFYEGYIIDYKLFAMLLCLCIPQGRVNLCMDRTEWKFGDTWHNILAITVQFGSTSIPIWVEILDKSRGASNFEERKAALQMVFQLLGKKRIRAFFADREFIGPEWMDFLLLNHIHFFIRLRNNQYFEYHGKKRQICKMLNGKSQRLFDDIGIYDTRLSLGIFKAENGKDMVAILTNTTAKRSRKMYRKRWSIEVFFQSLKQRGFNLEQTHIKEHQRLRQLIIMASLAFVLCLAIGVYLHCKVKKIPLKKHGYKAVSFARRGLDFIRETFKFNRSAKRIFNQLLDSIFEQWTIYHAQLKKIVG